MGKKRLAAVAGLADDSAKAALAALLAGPYARSGEEWAGDIKQCAAVGLLDIVLEVGIGCLVGQDGVHECRAAKNTPTCAVRPGERCWSSLAPSWRWELGVLWVNTSIVSIKLPRALWHAMLALRAAMGLLNTFLEVTLAGIAREMGPSAVHAARSALARALVVCRELR